MKQFYDSDYSTKIFITRFWEEEGVYWRLARIEGSNAFVQSTKKVGAFRHKYEHKFPKGTWFLSESDAIKDAMNKRDRRVGYLYRQIDKLNLLIFKVN